MTSNIFVNEDGVAVKLRDKKANILDLDDANFYCMFIFSVALFIRCNKIPSGSNYLRAYFG